MAFDATFPITGSTTWATLYAGLRANFADLKATLDLAVNTSWYDMSLYSYWSKVTSYARYMRDALGMVHLEGTLYCSNAGSFTCCVLNAGFRPENTAYFLRDYYLGNLAYMIVDGTGNISSTQSPTYLYLTGIQFKAA